MEGPIFVIPKKALRYYGKSGIYSIFYRIVCGSFMMWMTYENSQWCIHHRQQPLIAVEGYFLYITAWMFAVFAIADRINYICSFRLPCPNSLIYYWDFASAFFVSVSVFVGEGGICFNWKKRCKLQTDIFWWNDKASRKPYILESWQNEIEKGNYSLKL